MMNKVYENRDTEYNVFMDMLDTLYQYRRSDNDAMPTTYYVFTYEYGLKVLDHIQNDIKHSKRVLVGAYYKDIKDGIMFTVMPSYFIQGVQVNDALKEQINE